MIDIWTMQPLSVWEKLVEQKVLAVDAKLIPVWPEPLIDPTGSYVLDSGGSLKAYDWLVAQMKQRIYTPPDMQYPWWAWHTHNGRNAKPNLRRLGKRPLWKFYKPAKPMVCIHLSLHPDEVLRFDDDGWYAVLNWGLLAINATEFEEFDAEVRKAGIKPCDEMDHEPFRSQIMKSWNRIFDDRICGEQGYDPDWMGPAKGRDIEAAFWLLRMADVVDHQHFQEMIKR